MAFADIKIARCSFTLQQMTPIIHFQSSEKGATIRATEMKSKLDRFLVEFYGEEMKRAWVQSVSENEKGSDKLPAFRYKIQLSAEQVTALWDPNQEKYMPGGFFGDRNSYVPVMNKIVKVEIVCFDLSLMKKIQEVFPIFIAVTNFGTRQRMGYGGFKLKNSNVSRESAIRKYIAKMPNVIAYSFACPENEYDAKVKLNLIKDFHQHLKSGVNQQRYRYDEHKSVMLKQYRLKEEASCVNEKRAMKAALAQSRKFNIDKLRGVGTPHEKTLEDLLKVDLKKVIYKRGLLGFAGQYEFRDVLNIQKGAPKIKKLMFSVSAAGTESYIDKSTGREEKEKIVIKRFPSPITYLVDEKKIYVLVRTDHIKQLMSYHPRITFTLMRDGRVEGTKFHLSLPQSFDVEDFFDEVAKMRIPCAVRGNMGPIKRYFYQLRRL